MGVVVKTCGKLAFYGQQKIEQWWRHLTVPLRIVSILFMVAAVPVAWAQTFTVTASPSTLVVHPGDQNVPLNVSVSPSSYTGPISIALTGLPSGITSAPLTLAAGNSGTLLLSASVFADQEAFPAILGKNSDSMTVTVVAAAGGAQATSTITLTVLLSNPSFAPAPGSINLPVVKIDTSGVPITSKTTNVPGTITITSADGQTTYLPNASDSDNSATFHVHGNTTASMPKLPYKVKLNTSLDLLSAMGLSCPYVTGSGNPTCDKSKSYILLANYDDKTLLRDWAASALANAIPMGNGYLSSPAGSPSPSGTSTLMPWAPHSLFVELYLNGVYEGNYQLIEQIKVDSHRVNINELSESDTSSNQVTGGYLMEIDQRQDEAYVFHTPQGLPIGLQDPDFSPDPEVPEQTSYISNYVDEAENALFSANFTDPAAGWRHYFDEASAVNFYIVNDVMGNKDGGDFYSSVYLYKDKNNPLIYMGPVWDFDISSGNVYYAPIWNPTVPWMQTQAAWYKRWFMDPNFRADVVKQFDALQNNGVFTTWLQSIENEASSLEQSQASNFKRWPILGIRVWPNREAAGSYDGEVAYLTNYIKLRIAYLDSVFHSKAQTSTTLSIPASTVRFGSPATLEARVTGTGSGAPTGTVTFFVPVGPPGGTTEAVASLNGSGIASASVNDLPVGGYDITAVYSGDKTNALSTSGPVGITVLPPLIETTTSIASTVPPVDEGDSVTFTASVIGASGTALPTGSLTFTSNGDVLGMATLSAGGSATFSTTSLTAGDNSVQAAYSGDGNYDVSSSPAFVIHVSVPTFTLGAAPSSAVVKAGQAATFILTATPQGGFKHAVSFACSGLPAGGVCTFSPSTVTPDGSPVASALTISTAASTGNGISTRTGPGQPPTGTWVKFGGGFVLALLIWPVWWRRRWTRLVLVLVVVGSGMAVVGCGSSGTQQGGGGQQRTYSVTVTASGGTVTQTQVLNLTITD